MGLGRWVRLGWGRTGQSRRVVFGSALKAMGKWATLGFSTPLLYVERLWLVARRNLTSYLGLEQPGQHGLRVHVRPAS
jgi:hypothetical protein